MTDSLAACTETQTLSGSYGAQHVMICAVVSGLGHAGIISAEIVLSAQLNTHCEVDHQCEVS